MNVRELIAALEPLDPDLPVFAVSGDPWETFEVKNVKARTVYYPGDPPTPAVALEALEEQ